MIKMIFVFSLKPGVDPDEFTRIWEEENAAEFKKYPPLKKYVLNKLTQVTGGEQKFWGLVEMWYENEEEYKKYYNNSPVMERVRAGKFTSLITDGFAGWFEEKVIK